MTLVTASPAGPRTDLRDRPWFAALVVVALLLVFGVVVTRVVHRGSVAGWQVLATCTAPAGTVPTAVSATLDTSDCTVAPDETARTRDWPVISVALPGSAGTAPTVTRLRTDAATHGIVVEYRAGGTPVDGAVLVYLDVPPSAVPPGPVTVRAEPA